MYNQSQSGKSDFAGEPDPGREHVSGGDYVHSSDNGELKFTAENFLLGERLETAGAYLTEHVRGGQTAEIPSLSSRKLDLFDRYRLYRQALKRGEEETLHESPLPIVIKALYTIARYNPFAFLRFSKNSREVNTEQQEQANDDAYEFGVVQPLELLSQGKLEEALESFGKALDHAPNRKSDILATLGWFCVLVDSLQRNLQADPDFIRTLSHKRDAWEIFRSGLSTSKIMPEETADDDTEGASVEWSFSLFRNPFLTPPELDTNALEQALKTCSVPFRLVGADAFVQAAALHPDPRLLSKGIDVDSEQAAPNYFEGLALWLAGDPKEAVCRFELYQKEISRPDRTYMTGLTTLWTYKDAGLIEAAIENGGEFLKYNAKDAGEIYLGEFLSLCERFAASGVEQKTKWDIACSYLEASFKKLSPRGNFWAYPLMLTLGEAYENVGRTADAIAIYCRLSDLENEERDLTLRFQTNPEWRSKNIADCDRVRAELGKRTEKFQTKLDKM